MATEKVKHETRCCVTVLAVLEVEIKIEIKLPPPDPGRNRPKIIDPLKEWLSGPSPGPPRGEGGQENILKHVLKYSWAVVYRYRCVPIGPNTPKPR